MFIIINILIFFIYIATGPSVIRKNGGPFYWYVGHCTNPDEETVAFLYT